MKLSAAIQYPYIIFIILLYPLITAQIPYEYFEIQTIEPPYISKSLPPAAPNMPDKLGLDSNTDVAGDLQMSEPFAPPVKTYKRRMIFSQIRFNQSDFLIEPSHEPCHITQVQNAPGTHTLHRSALVFMDMLPNTIMDIPTDSPEMVITKIRAYQLDEDSSTEAPIELYQCPDDRYAVKTTRQGAYRIEYETAALEDSATPVDADFFRDAIKTNNVSTQQMAIAHELISSAPALKTILSSNTPLTDLILFFQSFDSQSLVLTNDSALMSMDLAKTILIQKKGLCRHRAILLMLIAQSMGYPIRIAANEVHAFIEIYHHDRWYPVELGGEAQSLTIQSTSNKTTVEQNFSFMNSSQNSSINTNTSLISDNNNTNSNSNHVIENDYLKNSFEYTNSNYFRTGNIYSSKNANHSINNKKSTFRFVPLINIPAHSTRHEALNISGQMVDEYSNPISNEIFFLSMKNGDRHLTVYAQTDNKGYISATIQIPPLWPLGETTLEWKRKRMDNN